MTAHRIHATPGSAHPFAPHAIEVHRLPWRERLKRAPLTWFCAGLIAGQLAVAAVLYARGGAW